ncbi:hypothetical protein JXB11_01110, partial [Candidatus Woesearchaeota archaeon]|nr:hypothetical protein [Candidatus Woesearchaeota archaeon]
NDNIWFDLDRVGRLTSYPPHRDGPASNAGGCSDWIIVRLFEEFKERDVFAMNVACNERAVSSKADWDALSASAKQNYINTRESQRMNQCTGETKDHILDNWGAWRRIT